ncbi:glycerol:H+ symporter (Gup1), partial [Aspergillus bombycis]
ALATQCSFKMTSILSWFRRLYSLDTLDTRFIISSNTPLKAVAADTRSAPAKDARANAIASNAAPPKWRTPEFWVYYVIFLIAVPLMFKTVIEVSQESHPTYPTYSHLLSPGWIAGRQVDNSDAQYSSFRDNIPYLLALLVAHPLLRRVYEHFVQPVDAGSTQSKTNATTAQGDARLARRVRFDFYFALIFIVALHGVSAIKVLGILYVNYKIAKSLPRQYVPTITWTFNIAILFANELCTGYPFERIATMLVSSADSAGQDSPLVLWGRYIDSFGGFNMDYYWSLDYPASSPIEKQADPTALSERDRVNIPAEPGPILTFNDYISQQRFQPLSLTRSRVTRYAVRFLLTVLAMEFILHFIYAVAISQAHPDWSLYSPGQLSMLGFFNLHIIWLKLLIPWRFFRLWALVDGVDPPENMVRCVSNNYSAFAFWRAWHRSFNRWIVRYVYVPLGGGRGRARGDDNKSSSVLFAKARQIFNFLIVFTFVALWHDLNLRLLMWGWLITLFVLPEIIATLLFPAHKWRSRPNTYRVLCGIGAVGNILMMMIANLVGFALGLDGIQGLLSEMLGSYSGLVYLATACAALFVGVQVMFEIRQEELRAGINLKC